MVLLTPGYWQTTYWPSQYWQEDYWPEYGAVVPPVAVTEGDAWLGPPVPHPKFPVYLLTLIRDYLKTKQNEE
jgi:hypothetical protein